MDSMRKVMQLYGLGDMKPQAEYKEDGKVVKEHFDSSEKTSAESKKSDESKSGESKKSDDSKKSDESKSDSSSKAKKEKKDDTPKPPSMTPPVPQPPGERDEL